MIHRANGRGWEGIPERNYKSETGSWLDVIRHTLFSSPDSAFQVRYFEIAPGGYSSFEKHRHEHCVVVLRGTGRVRLGDEWSAVELHDVVSVGPEVPHQFAADGETLGILCVVDAVRDRPVSLGNAVAAQTSEQG